MEPNNNTSAGQGPAETFREGKADSSLAEAASELVAEHQPLNDCVYFRSVDELETSTRLANILAKANITLIGELIQHSEVQMLSYKRFGRQSLMELKGILNSMELTLGTKIDNWPDRLRRRIAAQQAEERHEAALRHRAALQQLKEDGLDPAILLRSIDELEISVRSTNALHATNITLIGELVQRRGWQLRGTKRFGKRMLKEVEEVLSSMGLRLGMDLSAIDLETLRQQI